MNKKELRKEIIDILQVNGEKYFDPDIYVSHWGQYIIIPEDVVDQILDLFYDT